MVTVSASRGASTHAALLWQPVRVELALVCTAPCADAEQVPQVAGCLAL